MMRALLIGQAPPLPFEFVQQMPYDAVVIGSMTLGELLVARDERILQALAEGKSVYLYTPGLPHVPKNRALAASCATAQRELKNWGVLFTDGNRRHLITAEEARLMRRRGEIATADMVLTPLAKEILEGNA